MGKTVMLNAYEDIAGAEGWVVISAPDQEAWERTREAIEPVRWLGRR